MTRQLNLTWSRRAVLGAALTAPIAFKAAAAETYPSRNPRMIVPFPAGGPTDVLARIAAERVSPNLGQRVIVENRGGAGYALAAQSVMRAERDGYTLLASETGFYTTQPHLFAPG